MPTNEPVQKDQGKQPANRESAPPNFDEREEEGYSQPESGAQKYPADIPIPDDSLAQD